MCFIFLLNHRFNMKLVSKIQRSMLDNSKYLKPKMEVWMQVTLTGSSMGAAKPADKKLLHLYF